MLLLLLMPLLLLLLLRIALGCLPHGFFPAVLLRGLCGTVPSVSHVVLLEPNLPAPGQRCAF